MTKNGKVHISMKDIWEVICCHGNNIQTRIMFSFVDCYSWLIIIINNNNNNNNNIAIGHGVWPAWAAAYYAKLDAPYLQSLGYYPWQVIATPKAPLSGLRHLAIYGLNRKPNYCYHVFWFHLFLFLKTSCCVWWYFCWSASLCSVVSDSGSCSIHSAWNRFLYPLWDGSDLK